MNITFDGILLHSMAIYGSVHEYRYRIGFVSMIDGDSYCGVYNTDKDDLEFLDINRVTIIKRSSSDANKTKFPLYHRDIVTCALMTIEAIGEQQAYYSDLYSLEGLAVVEPINHDVFQVIPLKIRNPVELQQIIEGLNDRQHPFHKMDIKDFVSFLEL